MSSDASLRLGELNVQYERLLAELTDLETTSNKLNDSLKEDAVRLSEYQVRLEQVMHVVHSRKKQLMQASLQEEEEKIKKQQSGSNTKSAEDDSATASTVEVLKQGLVEVQELVQELEMQLCECEKEYAGTRRAQANMLAEIDHKKKLLLCLENEMKAVASS